jgi:hypothetical protein
MLVVQHSTATSLFFIRTDHTALPGRLHDLWHHLFTATRTKPNHHNLKHSLTVHADMSPQRPCSPLFRASTEQRSSSPPVQRDAHGGARAMSIDAMCETGEKKNFRSTGKPPAGCSVQICVRRRGADPGADGAAAGTVSATRGARFVLRPQNKAAKSGVFLLKPKEEARKGTKTRKNNRD